jgi:hypothetical protein
LTVPAVAVKLPVVEPAATVTEAGTVKDALLSDTATEVLAAGAADNVTVQVDVAPDAIVTGEHCSLETVGETDVVEIPPLVPDAVTATPPGETAITLDIGIDTLALAVAARVTLMVAITPSLMPVLFIPLAMHRTTPVVGAHVRVLPVAVRADPAAAVTKVMSVEL